MADLAVFLSLLGGSSSVNVPGDNALAWSGELVTWTAEFIDWSAT